MKATCSSETSVDFQQTTRRYMLEDNVSQPQLLQPKLQTE
jgi:hypothetical protein